MLDEIVNFGVYGSNDTADKISISDLQIDREIATITAIRDMLGIYLKGSWTMSYEEVVNFGSGIAPAILGDDRLFFNQKKFNPLYEEYRERAEALSQKEGGEITILEAVNRGIQEHEDLIRAGHTDLVVLRRKQRALMELAHELEPTSHSETNLIIRDAYKAIRGLPFENGKDYRDFKANGERGIRIRVLHPDHLEHITGADLIYECYSEEYKKVRVAAIQYKIRRSKTVHIDERIENQLERLENTFCNRGTCPIADHQNKSNFRLPYCTAFLRPTDEVQPNDPRFVSRGYYVPICVIKEIREKKLIDDPSAIPSKRLRDHAVSHKVFEELFNADMLGSNTTVTVRGKRGRLLQRE